MFRLLCAAAVSTTLVLAASASHAGSNDGSAAVIRLAQADAPADNTIKAAIGDLDRFEKQAASMRPGASTARRTLKLLGLTEGRLNGSSNKQHASWIAANDRLQALKQRLTDLAAGRTPGAAPAASQPAQSQGTTAVDPRLTQALAELARIDTAVEAMSPGDKVKGRQFINELNAVAKQLNAYPNRQDPNWANAARTYNALNKKTAAKANAPAPATRQPAQAAPAPTTPPASDGTTATSGASEQRVSAALKRLRVLEVGAARVTPGMPRDAASIVQELNALAKGVVPDEDNQHTRWDELTGRWKTLRTAMLKIVIDHEAVSVGNIVSQNRRDLELSDPLKVQTATETKRWRDFIANARQRHGGISDQGNAKVIALNGQIDDLEKLLEEKLAFRLAAAIPLWNGDWPEDVPVLIDSIGHDETRLLAQVHVGRPLTWVPEPFVYVRFADHEPDDVIVMQVMADGKAIGKPMVCGPKRHAETIHLIEFNCRPGKEFGLTETGVLTVKLSYKQTLLETTHHLADLRLDVIQINHGSQNNPEATYAETHDMRLSVATFEETTGQANDTNSSHLYATSVQSLPDPSAIATTTIRFWTKDDRTYGLVDKMTCFLGKKKVGQTQILGTWNRGYWSHTKTKKINVGWHRNYAQFHDMPARPGRDGNRGTYAKDVHFLSENPGEYRCVATGKGEIVKEIFFTIGDDGRIVTPACQAQSMKSVGRVTLLIKQKNREISSLDYDAEIGRRIGFAGNVTWQGDCPIAE